jgi:hypothetical protein
MINCSQKGSPMNHINDLFPKSGEVTPLSDRVILTDAASDHRSSEPKHSLASGASPSFAGGRAVINTTPEPYVIAKGEELQRLFEEAVREASDVDRARRKAGKTTTTASTLARVLAKRLDQIASLDHQTVKTIFSFFEACSGPRKSQEGLARALAALMVENVTNAQLTVLKRWLKFVFYRLWTRKAFVFPINFYPSSSFEKNELREILPPVATCHLENPNRDFASLGLRITLSSMWWDFEKIDLDVWGEFSIEVSQNRDLRDKLGIIIEHPTAPLTAVLKYWAKAGIGNGFSYTEEEIDSYFYWVKQIRQGMSYVEPTRFIPSAKEYEANKRKASNERFENKRKAAQADLLDHHDKEEIREQILEGNTNLPTVRLQTIVQKTKGGEVPIEYFRFLRAKGIRRSLREAYPYRMHAFPVELWNHWDETFDIYFDDRARRGYERINTWESFRYVFRDYLACYLPWWNEVNPLEAVNIPNDPSEFTRFGLWVEGAGDGKAPLPLLSFWDQARIGHGADGFNGFVNDTFSFFAFCRGQASILEYGKQEFPNPVISEVDQRRSRGKSKTNKDPIPKAVVPYLLRYAYAAEGFFTSLYERTLSPGLTDDERRLAWRPDSYSTAEWNVPVSFEFDERVYQIDTIPNFPVWEKRWIRDAEQVREVNVPHISALRMVIAALETGIRFQGIQWLCRKTFNSLYNAEHETAALVPLVVSTDKVKDHPWKTLIVRRVHDLLMREERFQASIHEFEFMVNYEGREHTRFAPILPLFRGANSNNPTNDKSYATAWERLLVGFSYWYERNVEGAQPLRMFWLGPDKDQLTGEPRVEMHFDGEKSYPCCPLRLRLKHTPHSARSTFISARSGILPVEVTMELVGQTNKASTYHYTVETEEEIAAKVLAAADYIWAPDPDNPVHIRADKAESALRRSFEADRNKTEIAFGFQTLSLLNEERADLDGIQLLRSTQMGNIAFRETHICPVGEQCPADVMDVIVEPRRCGLCPLAVKSVDHVTAIAAKERMLLEQARDGRATILRMQKRGEPVAAISAVQERRTVDILECQAWKTTRQALDRVREDLKGASSDVFIAGMPDAVKLHLRHVARDPDMAEFIIERIEDSRNYASVETPTVRAQARQLRQRLLQSAKAIDAEIDLLDADPVEAFVSTLKVALEAHGIQPTFAAAIQAVKAAVLPSTPKAPLLTSQVEEA